MSGEELPHYGQSQQLRQFLRGWMQNPAAVGALVPSGRLLARYMASGLGAGSRVIELGAGTGCVTRAILQAGVRSDDLTVVEQNEDFCRLLRARFPSVTVLEADARTLAQCSDGIGDADCVVSSLPLLLFSAADRADVLRSAFALLKRGGVFQQFTYGGRCPIERALRDELDLSAKLRGVVPFNLPPAFVYRLERRRP
jgi:phosphatidylethanolamine/phosphatidyl-N-methylethanolamine N-methyltransferase